MATIAYWPADAPTVGMCRCGGPLKLVEDSGPTVPVEVQCSSCLELSGVPHNAVRPQTVVPGSPDDLGF